MGGKTKGIKTHSYFFARKINNDKAFSRLMYFLPEERNV